MVAQLFRTLIIRVPAAWLLSLSFGVTGVWISAPVSTIVCFGLTAGLIWWLLRRLEATLGPAGLRHEPEPEMDFPPPG
jgi:Na+-driven multidrug efflux pump